ncbi:MAG: WD40/YVTN/BNR-like repeat-containing protein [Acidimicrobiia bacterium]
MTEALRGVAAKPDGSLTVAVGDNGSVVTSADQGGTWTVRTGPNTTDDLKAVAWNGTWWVAVGDAGAGPIAWRSTDGITWTRHVIVSGSALPATIPRAQIAVLGTNFFAAVGATDSVYKSADGSTWTVESIAYPGGGAAQVLVSPGGAVSRIVAGAGVLVAAHNLSGNTTTFSTSSGGGGWAFWNTFSMIVDALATDGSSLVAVGRSSTLRSEVRALTPPNTGGSGAVFGAAGVTPQGMVWSGEDFVFVGDSDDAWRSATGLSWGSPVDTPSAGQLLAVANCPAAVPTAPTLVSPANNAPVDFDDAQSFEGRFNDPDLPNDHPSAVALSFVRTVPSAAAEKWWDGAAWQSSETYLTQTSPIVTIPGGQIGTSGEAYSWKMKMKDAAGNASPASAARSVVGSDPPTVTVDAPAGTVTTTTVPPTEITYGDAESAAQESVRVRTFTAAQYGAGGFDPATSPATFDTGVVYTNAASVPRAGDLANGVTYRDYVQVTQVGGQASTWEYSEFTVDIDAPEPPTLTAQPQPSQGRVMLVAAGPPDPYDEAVYLFEYHDSGAWVTLPGGVVDVSATETYAAFDHLLPPGVHRTYRASIIAALSTASQVRSAPSSEQTVVLDLDDWWLKHPTLPELNLVLEVDAPGEIRHRQAVAVFDPIGSREAVVQADVAKGRTMTLRVFTTGPTARAALETLLEAQSTLLLQSPFGQQWWVRVAGDVTETHVWGPGEPRWWSIPFVEVASPIG